MNEICLYESKVDCDEVRFKRALELFKEARNIGKSSQEIAILLTNIIYVEDANLINEKR